MDIVYREYFFCGEPIENMLIVHANNPQKSLLTTRTFPAGNNKISFQVPEVRFLPRYWTTSTAFLTVDVDKLQLKSYIRLRLLF